MKEPSPREEKEIQKIMEELRQICEEAGPDVREEYRLRMDAQNVRMYRGGIAPETLCMMLTDYAFALRAITNKTTAMRELLTDGMMAVAEERCNQIHKGYDAKHDDEHADGSIASLAAFIVAPPSPSNTIAMPPWASRYADHILDKHKDRLHVLTIGAALIVAEIERIIRKRADEAAKGPT